MNKCMKTMLMIMIFVITINKIFIITLIIKIFVTTKIIKILIINIVYKTNNNDCDVPNNNNYDDDIFTTKLIMMILVLAIKSKIFIKNNNQDIHNKYNN